MIDVKFGRKFDLLLSTLMVALVLPLSYFRTAMLGQQPDGADLIATLATTLLISQFATSICIFGTPLSYSRFYPTMNKAKRAWLANYIFRISLALMLFGFFLTLFSYIFNFKDAVAYKSLSQSTVLLLVLAYFSLSGFLEIYAQRLAGYEKNLVYQLYVNHQVFSLSAILFCLWLFGLNVSVDSLLVVLVLIKIMVLLLVLSNDPLGKSELVDVIKPEMEEIRSFLRYSYFSGVISFVYMRIDQIYILLFFDKKSLAGYFVSVTIAQLVTFLPKQMSHVILRYFVKIKGQDEYRRYIVVGGLTIGLSVFVFTLIYGLNELILPFFGSWAASYSEILVLLSLVGLLGCLGPVNSMYSLAKSEARLHFFNSMALILVQVFSIALLAPLYGIKGLIAAKALATLSGQLGLTYIVSKTLGNSAWFHQSIIFIFVFLIYFLVYGAEL
ncbi:hypothetical protein DYI22_09440 [Marinobacter lipolyticus]|uniref:hypothetical protein n=1 Tax=Marinobacter lipolyticus TaxID=209639 RepID=UPI001BD0ADF1|nr:hypothetical protein [Marinobacter lipolyticus]MBS8240733.1 hypothetical protein [Marinobacter lipolyticus]